MGVAGANHLFFFFTGGQIFVFRYWPGGKRRSEMGKDACRTFNPAHQLKHSDITSIEKCQNRSSISVFLPCLNYSCLGCSVSWRKTKPSIIWPCHSLISYAVLQLIFRPALYLPIYLTSLYFWWWRPPIGLLPFSFEAKISFPAN